MSPWLVGLAAVLVGVAGATAQEPAKASTAQEGQLLPGPFRVYAVTGPRAQFMHDFFGQQGLNPAVAVIALQAPANPQDPLAVFLQKLNGLVAARKADKLGAFAIFLTLGKDFYEDDVQERARKVGGLEGLSKQLNLAELPLGLSHPEATPVKQYGVVTRDDPINMVKRHLVTVLVYNRHKVARRFVFTEDKKLDEAAMKEIFTAVENMLPAKK